MTGDPLVSVSRAVTLDDLVALAVGEPLTDGERDALVARLERKGVEGRRRLTAMDPRRRADREDLGARCSNEPEEPDEVTRAAEALLEADPGTDSWDRLRDPFDDDG